MHEMKKLISAGILINSKGKFLLIHPYKGCDKCWGVPKGKMEPNETLLDTAIREVKEETGLDMRELADKLYISSEPIYDFKVGNNNKHVYIFYAEDTDGFLQKKELHCNTYIEGKTVHEIDNFMWCSLREIEEKLTKSQKGLIDLIRSNHYERCLEPLKT